MIKGESIFLRAPEMSDIDLLYEWENDPATWAVSNTLTPVSKFTLEQYILNAHLDIYQTRQVRFMIVNQADQQAIGTIDLFDYEPTHHRAGVGIYLTEDERGRGKADETLGLIIDYCFNILMLKQIYCNIAPNNEKSIALFTKNGFSLIGTKRSWLLIRNEWQDENMYQLINS